jgi:hypothetical protein
MHRPTVGIIALALLLAWAALFQWPIGSEGNEALQGACLRVGVVMAALWSALPQLRRVPGWLVSLVVALGLIVAVRPRLILLAVPVLLVVWLLRPRQRNRRPNR